MAPRAQKANHLKRVDSVRASKDGHQFHEAWVARRALGLLLPRFDLCGIAVEGLSEEDEEGAPAAAVEIADATFYYGDGKSFETCARMEVAQFKYSINKVDTPLRIADLRKTLAKFSATEKEFLAKHGPEAVAQKVTYSINSNRPFASELLEAFRSASTGRPASADADAQLTQLRSAVKQPADGLQRFADRVLLVGRLDSLEAVERGNARTVADWSASNDALARARIGDLRDMVRRKAGSHGQRDKLVTQVDVLSALGLGHESELLPTPQAFPEVGNVVRRAQLSEFIASLPKASRWIVQASGGLGKTVFVQSLAAELAQHHEVVLFDCFGGGSYRTLADGRHRPERGLLHVVNELACRGLCDPILPGTSDSAEVVRRSIHRFKQAIGVVRRSKPRANLFVIIDAADNAAMEAANRHQWSFPRELLDSLTTQEPVEGLTVIVTARPERVAVAIGNADCRPFEITPFTLPEAEAFISARRAEATPSQIEVVHHRAEGNPRVIANLIEPDRDLVSETQTDAKVELNDLIQERIARAVQLAELKGATSESIAAFLCGLSLLPPPVPVGEAAIAFGVPPSEIESFAADLAPLLDRTRHGIIFRDEPTETFVSQRYGAHVHLLNDVVARLTTAQSQSVYAARSLPGLLSAMGRVDQLHRLAFDTAFPATLTGDVAKRVIRLNRLRTALGAAARARHHDAIVDMLVELSSVVAVDERGQDYLLAHPDPFSTRYAVPWVLSVAAHAAAETRVPTLFDCLPTELWMLVKDDSVAASDQEQLDLLQTRLKAQPAGSDGGAPKQMSTDNRRQADDSLKTRIPAVLALAKRVAAIAIASDAQSRSVSLAEFFDGWKSAVAEAQKDYRYRTEDARFIDNLYSECALQTFIALNAFTSQTAAACLDWIGRAEFTPIPLFTELVAGFARNAETAQYAGTIAAQTAAAIGHEDDVVQRANLLARLARAILPADRVEATALFTRGLADLDAIGSGDYAFTNELLWFAKSVTAEPLAPDVAHRLAKICELNVYDSRKFPWTLAAAAFSRCWGAAYLAQLSRWHDRDKVALAATLPPAVSFLIRDGRVRPDDALALLRLVEPEMSWDWDWDHLVESIIESRPEALGILLGELLSQFERVYPKRPHAETVGKIRSQVATAPRSEPLCAELDRLLARTTGARRVQRGSDRANYIPATKDDEVVRKETDRKSEIAAAVNATNPLSVASIETLVETLDGLDRALDVKADAFAALRGKVAYVDRSQHIGAIVSARNLELFAKNKLLASLKADWLSSSPSELSVLKDAATSLVRQHASELVAKEWGSLYELRELSQVSGIPHHELAIALVESAATDELETASTVWLRLATDISPKADPSVARTALSRLLNSGAARLADGVGDGGWTSALHVDGAAETVTAGLIWFCLGLPDARDRWRAAHAVRTLAQFGRWTVIGELFERLDASGAGPFQDQRLPFFTMHAQQWFLLAIARIALDHRREIRRHRQRLEAIALNDRFPHVGLREPARHALMSCLKNDRSKAAARTIKKLQKVHVSAFRPVQRRINTFGTMSWDRPKTAHKPKAPFHFDYDFDKHDLSRVGNIFGVPTWKIADRCISWIRKWDRKIEYMHDFGGRERPSGHSNYTAGAEEGFQSYGAYLARHALALTAGRLLLTTPLSVDRYTFDRWDEWVARYSPTRPDGLWLSDGLGTVPDFALHDLMADESKGHPKPCDEQALLRSLTGVSEDGRIPQDLMVDGSWSSPDGVRVNVSSALVPPQQAMLASRAVVTAPLMDMWLPSLEPGEDDNADHVRFGRDVAPLEAWITDPHVELQIDDNDPAGVRDALQRPRPATRVIRTFRLRPEKPWANPWIAPGKRVAFRSRAWGRQVGDGDRKDSDSGAALFATRPFLADLLTATDRDLLLLIKLQHFRESEGYSPADDEPSDRFTHAYSLLLVDRQLRVRPIVPTPGDVATVASLDKYSIHDFQKRFTALSKSGGE